MSARSEDVSAQPGSLLRDQVGRAWRLLMPRPQGHSTVSESRDDGGDPHLRLAMVCRRIGRAAGPGRLDDSVEQHVAAPGDEQHVGLERWSSGQPEADHPGGARDSGATSGCNGAAEISFDAAGGMQRAGEADGRARKGEQRGPPEIPAAREERPGGPVAYPQVAGQSPA